VVGVRALDAETGEALEVRARVVINATGVWTDRVRRMDDPEAPAMVTVSQGIHIVLDKAFLPATTRSWSPAPTTAACSSPSRGTRSSSWEPRTRRCRKPRWSRGLWRRSWTS
jgi:glycine/D-amino acid oxidase-like deaminating enzyme